MILPTFKLNIERWKFNKEFGIYVSNKGHFKNQYRKDLHVKINQNGYCLVKTSLGHKLAHRVVMLTWRPTAEAESLTIDHLDHNKRNNSLDNLEWVTKEENQRRSVRDTLHGCTQNAKIRVNNSVWMTKEELINFISFSEGAKNTSKETLNKTVNAIFNGKKKKAYGLSFKAE